jgi:hypothetical protein
VFHNAILVLGIKGDDVEIPALELTLGFRWDLEQTKKRQMILD